MTEWVQTTEPELMFGVFECVAGHWHAALTQDEGEHILPSYVSWQSEESALIFGRPFAEQVIQTYYNRPWSPSLN